MPEVSKAYETILKFQCLSSIHSFLKKLPSILHVMLYNYLIVFISTFPSEHFRIEIIKLIFSSRLVERFLMDG